MNKRVSSGSPNYKRLAAYATAAGAVLGLSPKATAQVIYTDVDPDQTYMNNGDTLTLDINSDGIDDFRLVLVTISNISTSTITQLNYINAEPLVSSNAVYNTASTFTNSSGTTSVYVARAMNVNDPINAGLNWYATSANILAADVYINNSSSTLSFQLGPWMGQNYKYLGLRFDISGNTHYGWVRLSVAGDAGSFTIMDYAYESMADTEILTGEGSPVGIQPLPKKQVAVYGFGRQLHVHFRQARPEAGTISVYTTLGQEVHRCEITGQHMNIPLDDLPENVYLIRIHSGTETISRKIYLH